MKLIGAKAEAFLSIRFIIVISILITLFQNCSLFSSSVVPESNNFKIQNPVFTKSGTIVCGSKSVWLHHHAHIMMCIDNDAICRLAENFDLGKGNVAPIYFLDNKFEFNPTNSIYTADVRDSTASETKLGKYSLNLSLLENGLIKVESKCAMDNPALIQSRYSNFDFPPYITLSGKYTKADKEFLFDDKQQTCLRGEELSRVKISFFPDIAAKSFSIVPEKCSEILITRNSIRFKPDSTGDMSFILDIRGAGDMQKTSETTPNGIDFWETDKLHLPDYGASRNLIMNPSFEAGFRYWAYPQFAQGMIPLKYQNFYQLDNKQAHSGSHSLRIKVLPIKCPLPLGSFATPFVSGKQYTLSFYAKGSCDKNLEVCLWGRELRNGDKFLQNIKPFSISSEWKRYSTPLVPDDRFGAIFFRAQMISADPNQQEETVWLDDIQLEDGPLTDFNQAPVSAQITSTAWGNFIEFGRKPDFKLVIQSKPSISGTVSLGVEDFFFNKIFQDTYQFKTDKAGNASIELNKLNSKIFSAKTRGVFVINAVFSISGINRPFKDYFRFSIMDFLDNTQKNKNIFNLPYVYSLQSGGPDMERFMERERAIGFGSISYGFGHCAIDFDYSLDKERMQMLKKYGFESTGRDVVMTFSGENGEISEENGKFRMINIKSMINPTVEQLAEFENTCAVKARNRPWNKTWWFAHETNPGCDPLQSNPDAFARFLLATLKGIKKGNPNAKVLIEGGPWSMDPEHGTKWVEGYIQNTKSH